MGWQRTYCDFEIPPGNVAQQSLVDFAAHDREALVFRRTQETLYSRSIGVRACRAMSV